MSKIHYTATIQNQGENDAAASEQFRSGVERYLTNRFPDAQIVVDQNDRISSSQLGVSDDLDEELVREIIQRYWDSGDWYLNAAFPASLNQSPEGWGETCYFSDERGPILRAELAAVFGQSVDDDDCETFTFVREVPEGALYNSVTWGMSDGKSVRSDEWIIVAPDGQGDFRRVRYSDETGD
jgi:hypothetical protein